MFRNSKFIAGLLFACLATQASASVTFSGSSGLLGASVEFNIVNGQLQVKLTNTSTADVLVPADVLTAVYFNITGNPMLTRVSAISNGSTYDGTTLISGPGTTVGGEWAYLNSLSAYGANSGISSSGLGIFGPGDVFPGPNLAGPVEPDGLQYGITSAGDNLATGNGGTAVPLTKNSVIFTLGAGSLQSLPANFLSTISNVTFQYGTNSATEPHFGGGGGNGGGTSVPEPETVLLLGVGTMLVALSRRRRR